MERRAFLITAGLGLSFGLAGCSSDEGSTSNGDSEGSGDTSSQSLEDLISLVSHEFGYDGSVLLNVTVENVTDSELSLINIQSNLYIDNERVGDSSMNISNLPAGTQDTAEVPFRDLDPRDRENVTNYDITVQTSVDGQSYEGTFEYDGGISLQ